MKKLIVNNKYNQKKLNKFIQDTFPNVNNSLFFKTLRKKDIKINGKRISANVELHNGDEVLLYISDDLLKSDVKFNIPIIFEDTNIIVFNKPRNLEVTGNNSLTSIVHQKYSDSIFKPMPCHRIDRNTSGLVLFAKNQKSLDILLSKFKNHEIEKHYHALVYGIPKEKYKRSEAFLFKDSKKSQVFISPFFKKGYQKIITTYTVIKYNSNNTSLLDIQIETGKTHQIRAHLAYLGFPIIGDGKYGKNEINKKFSKKYQMLENFSFTFNFKTNSDILEYLNGLTISLPNSSLIK